MQTTMMDPAQLRAAKFNPTGRTEAHRLKYLRQSMETHGFLTAFPIIATADYTVADGHRRLAVALALGMTKVPVMLVDDLTADQYWSLNAVGQSPTATEVLEAYTRGMQTIPERSRREIELLQATLGGKRALKALFAKGAFTPAVYHLAKRLANYCGRGDDAEFLTRVTTWIVEKKMQRAVTVALANDADPDVLVSAVQDDRALTMVVAYR